MKFFDSDKPVSSSSSRDALTSLGLNPFRIFATGEA
jgi:hypothetical protein